MPLSVFDFPLDQTINDDTDVARRARMDLQNAESAAAIAHGFRIMRGIHPPQIPRGFAMAVGKSPRGVAHAVIVKDGKLWHDPHPSRAGIDFAYDRIGATEFYVLVPLLPVLFGAASSEEKPSPSTET